jgi:hypothetical protein
MKNCKTCPKLVKNNFNFCYECKDKQENKCQGFIDEDSPEVITTPTAEYQKQPIPKTIKNALWINYFKDSRTGLCLCCKRETITMGNYHAGHIIAEVNGGSTSLDNLIPLCMLCNCSMGKQNVFDFIKKYNLWFGLNENDLPLNTKI